MPSPDLPGLRAPRPRPAPAIAMGVGGGLLSGLFGVGGGIVLVPALVSLFKFPQRRAQATSLAAIVLTAMAGAITYSFSGHFHWLAAGLIAAGGIGGSILGAELAARWSDDIVRFVFAIFVIVAAIRLLLPAAAETGQETASGPLAMAAYALAGLVMGTLSALVGVGGGVILVPILILLFHFPAQTAQGTSLLVMIPIAAAGAWRNARHGFTDVRTGALLGAGGIVGSPLGALAAVALPTDILQRVFALLLFFSAGQMLWLPYRARRRRAGGEGRA